MSGVERFECDWCGHEQGEAELIQSGGCCEVCGEAFNDADLARRAAASEDAHGGDTKSTDTDHPPRTDGGAGADGILTSSTYHKSVAAAPSASPGAATALALRQFSQYCSPISDKN